MGGKLGQFNGNITYVPGQIGAYVNEGFISGTAGDFQSVVIPSLDHLNIYDPEIKPVKPKTKQSRFLGFEAEDIMTAEVFCCKVFDKDVLNQTRINEHITYDIDALDNIDYCKNYANTGHKQFDLYYRHGMWDYYNHLPDAQITSASIPPADIEAAIKTEQGVTNVFIDRITLGVPTDKDWIRYYLQEQFGYDIAKDTLKQGNGYYKLGDYSFDRNTGKFTVTMEPYQVARRVEYKYERVLHNTYATEWCYYQTTYKRFSPDGSVYDADSHKLLGKGPGTTTDWQLVSSNEHIWVYDTNYGQGLGTSFDLGGVEPVATPQNPITFEVPGILNGMYYTVHYRTDIDDVKFWIHRLDDNTYPSLNNPLTTLKDFDMFPIVCLRAVFRFIHDWPDNDERVEETKELLSHIGIDYDQLVDNVAKSPSIGDVRDAFFGMGVSPNNNSWAVSAALYESLNWIFNLLPPNVGSVEHSAPDATKYGVSFKETPFNSTVFFQYRNSSYVDGQRYHVDWKDYDLWESEYSHEVKKIRVSIREYHDVKIAKSHDVSTNEGGTSPNFRLYIAGGRKRYEYRYSDEPGKVYTRYGDVIPSDICYCESNADVEDGGGCGSKCIKYGPYAVDMTYTSGWWSMENVPVSHVLWSETYETTYLLRVVFQVHRYRYHYIDVVDVHQTYIIQDRGETAVKNIYPDNDKFVFPLSVEVEQKLTLMEKTNLLGEACYLFFYAVKWQHLEWYETPAFGTFLGFLGFVITAVITVVSLGTISWQTMTTMQLLLQALKSIVIPLALNLALQAIDALVDSPLLKTALSIGAMVASFVAASYFGNGMKFDIKLDIGSAVKMCQLPMKAIDIYNGAVFKKEAMELAKQQGQFYSTYQSRMSEIESAMAGLGSGIDTSFLANLSYNDTYKEVASMMILPQDYYAMAMGNDTPQICSRSMFCQLTVNDYIKNSLRLR